jgi:hypothetical protein
VSATGRWTFSSLGALLATLACDVDPSSSSRDAGPAEAPDVGAPLATPDEDGGAEPEASGDAASSPAREWACVAGEDDLDFLSEIGCLDDFLALASRPIDEAIPGARSVKTSVDRDDAMALSFQNSVRYPIHWDFVSENRSVAQMLPRVPTLSEFNLTEYFSPSRRFLLGALTHYEGPDAWVYEIAPYDSSTPDLVEAAFRLVAEHSYVGSKLRFHPTSQAIETVAEDLPSDIPLITTDELFDGIDYQPLNPAESVGKLRFIAAAELDTDPVGFRDIVVLDHVPSRQGGARTGSRGAPPAPRDRMIAVGNECPADRR